MKLKKELVDELIRITKMYYETGETNILTELHKTENKLKQTDGGIIGDVICLIKDGGIIYDVISLIEDLAKFTENSGKGTYEDIYKALEVFGVIVV